MRGYITHIVYLEDIGFRKHHLDEMKDIYQNNKNSY